MLKKFIPMLLAICMIICLTACDEITREPSVTTSEVETSVPDNTTDGTTTEPSETESDTTQGDTTASQTEPADTTEKPEHKHSYSNATCTSPKKCSCGETSGSALGHNYSSATCTSPSKCTRCGTTKGDKLEHKYEGGICSACGAIDEAVYVELRVNAAEQAFTDYTKYNDALKIINEAIQKCPANEILKSKKDYYQSFAPVYLSDVEPYEKSYWFKQLDEDTDVFNTVHYHCIRIAKDFTTADGTFDLSAKYNTFTATVYGLGDGEGASLKIYADGVCVYSNTSINPSTRPFEITIDVTGVMDLKFEMSQYSNSPLVECFGLSNVYVQKTAK